MRQVSERTEAALQMVYSAFTQNGAPQSIVVCPCCVSADELEVMTKSRLRELSAEQLEHYLSAVFLTSGAQEDFRYFLPRLLDLNARAKWDFESDWEILLGKLSLGEWQTWSEREREALTAFLQACFEDLVSAGMHGATRSMGFYADSREAALISPIFWIDCRNLTQTRPSSHSAMPTRHRS